MSGNARRTELTVALQVEVIVERVSVLNLTEHDVSVEIGGGENTIRVTLRTPQ